MLVCVLVILLVSIWCSLLGWVSVLSWYIGLLIVIFLFVVFCLLFVSCRVGFLVVIGCGICWCEVVVLVVGW